MILSWFNIRTTFIIIIYCKLYLFFSFDFDLIKLLLFKLSLLFNLIIIVLGLIELDIILFSKLFFSLFDSILKLKFFDVENNSSLDNDL